MKIAMITTFYPPHNFGGDGIAVRRLARGLARDGQDVSVIHPIEAWEHSAGRHADAPATRVDDDGVRVHALRTGAGTAGLVVAHQLGRPAGLARALRRALREIDPDVIHFHNVSLIGGPGVLREGRAVKLCTFHDYWFVCPMHVLWRFDREACRKRSCLRCTLAGRRPPQLWRIGGPSREATGQIDAWLAPSETAREQHLRNGFPHEIRVLPHFVIERRVTPAADPPHARPYFLFVGRLERLKGILDLLEWFRRYDRADLVIAGDGTLRPEVETRARGLDHVRVLGRVDEDDLASWYRHAIAVVAPSPCYETFGLTPLEGFSNGTPAIVSDGGALAELVRATEAGIIAATGDEWWNAMESLRTNGELRRELGRRGLDAAKSFYGERAHLDRYYAIIDEIRTKREAEK